MFLAEFDLHMSLLRSSIHLTEDEIVRCLSQSEGSTHSSGVVLLGPKPPRPAAVLVPLIQNPIGLDTPGWHVLYTHRTDLVQDHKGQVSFPGGSSDPEDSSIIGTALREAHEEIGLNPSDVKILGQMESFTTITNYLVTPIIGLIPWPYSFVPEPQEVSRVFTIPMDWMADPVHYEIRKRELPSDFPVPLQFQHLQLIYFKQYDGETLWGATAGITLNLLRILGMIK